MDFSDRAMGALLGTAVGDALGAGYEFAYRVDVTDVTMLPGRLTGRPAGHWTDDTDMAMAIALAARQHGTLDSHHALNTVAENFLEWYASNPPDVGMQTRAVLSRSQNAAGMAEVASDYQAERPDAAGNGSLMRTAPVALANLSDLATVAKTAREISSLTHPHPDAQDACALWSVAIAVGVSGSPSPRNSMNVALTYLHSARVAKWREILNEAERCELSALAPNGWVIRALQAAWRATVEAEHSDVSQRFSDGVRFAISLGDDTDTIAAITGGLLGAHYGASTIPVEWCTDLSGWPDGYGEQQLRELALNLVADVD